MNERVFVCGSISRALCCLRSGLITLTGKNDRRLGANVRDMEMKRWREEEQMRERETEAERLMLNFNVFQTKLITQDTCEKQILHRRRLI